VKGVHRPGVLGWEDEDEDGIGVVENSGRDSAMVARARWEVEKSRAARRLRSRDGMVVQTFLNLCSLE